MLMFGMRHALDVDHITAIDNLVRLYNAKAKSRWVGTGFSIGHMLSVMIELILIICVVGNTTNSKLDELSLSGSIIGAIALAAIGAANIYSMKKWGRTGSAIFAGKIAKRTQLMGPLGSALITGLVFGLGFDTATHYVICRSFCNLRDIRSVNFSRILRHRDDSNRHNRQYCPPLGFLSDIKY